MRPVVVFSVSALLLLLSSFRADAQAWVPWKGEGALALSYQGVTADGHFLEDGSKLPGYATEARNLVVNLSYGLTDKLAFNLSVPFVNVKYLGPEEPFNLPLNTLDDGTFNGAVTDLGFALRYNLIEEPVVLTPFFNVGLPSHDYETLGESAAGRGFQEYRLGTHVGRTLDPFLRRAFVHGTYTYAFVRQDIDIPLNYSSFAFEAGYFVHPSLSVSLLWRQHWTHGGLSFNELFEAPADVFVNLDRVVRISFQHLGVAATYSVSDTVSVFGNYLKFVDGVDAHYGDSFAFGMSWTFKQPEGLILFP